MQRVSQIDITQSVWQQYTDQSYKLRRAMPVLPITVARVFLVLV